MKSTMSGPSFIVRFDEGFFEILKRQAPNRKIREILDYSITCEVMQSFRHVFEHAMEREILDHNGEVIDPTNTYPGFTLHVTHNDADAVGCAVEAQLFSNWWYSYTSVDPMDVRKYSHLPPHKPALENVVVMIPAYNPAPYIVSAALIARWVESYFAEMVSGFSWKQFIISDLYCSDDAFSMINVILEGNSYTSCLYVDHHSSNPNCNQPDHILESIPVEHRVGMGYTVPKCWVQSKLSMGQLRPLVAQAIGQPCDLFDSIENDRFVQTSAALQLTLYFLMYMRSSYATALTPIPNHYQKLMMVMLFFGLEISQWDTFSWRDFPELNMGHEFDLIYLQSFYSDIEMKNLILDYLVDQEADTISCRENILPEKKTDAIRYGEMAHWKFYQEAEKNMVYITLEQFFRIINDYVEETESYDLPGRLREAQVQFPDGFILCPYPLGNTSILVEWLQNGDRYKTLVQEKSTWMLLFDWKNGTLSLRTKMDGESARLDRFAKAMGGGGHPQAAGFRDMEFAHQIRMTYCNACYLETNHSSNT